MKYQAVIFDFDYTLGDSTEGIVASVTYGLQKLGHNFVSREAICKTIGFSLKEIYCSLTGKESEEETEKFEKYFREKADQVMVANTNLFSDTIHVLHKLKAQKVKIGIVTTKYHYRMDAILEKCQATSYIDNIIGVEDVKVPKPNPEGVLKLLASWNLHQNQVLYVGDSIVDAKTAEAAGVDFAGVTTGTTSREELEGYPHIGVYQNLDALQKNLEEAGKL